MNTFGWVMAHEEYRFTRFVLIDSAFIEIQKRGTKPWFQTAVWCDSAADAHRKAVGATERLQRLGYDLVGTVKAADMLVAPNSLMRECGRDHSVGPLLNGIIINLEEHGLSA